MRKVMSGRLAAGALGAIVLAGGDAQAAIAACNKAGCRIGVAVIDLVGEARALLTADGSDGSHVFELCADAVCAGLRAPLQHGAR